MIISQRVVPDILMRDVKAKFSQVRSCKEYLQLTKGMILGEANRTDSFYGIGFALYANEKVVSNPVNWRNNLLGKSLIANREYLEGDVPDEVDDYFDDLLWSQSQRIETPYDHLTESQFTYSYLER